MASSMLSFVLNHVPNEWEDTNYSSSYELFPLDKYSREYQTIAAYFNNVTISRIQRVQNPYQYGRYMIRREMTKTNFEEVVFHIIQRDELTTALQFNCDHRRYKTKFLGEDGKNPKFYRSFTSLVTSLSPISDYIVLVLNRSTATVETQADYYIRYIVKF